MPRTTAAKQEKRPKEIRITCKGAAMVPISDLKNLQGNLKTLHKKDYEKLKATIEQDGFSFPVFVWKDKKGKQHIVDGHQRVATVREMLKDGYALPKRQVPIAWIEADSKTDALKKVLLAASQYGKYTEESVYEFVNMASLDFPELKMKLDLPQLSMSKLSSGWFEDNVDPQANEVPSVPVKPTSKTGDVFAMGRHRLICGDSTNAENVGRLMGRGKKKTGSRMTI
jgi:hypothetical protein